MANRSIFYGWWVVGAFSVTTFISTGVRHAVAGALFETTGGYGAAFVAACVFLAGAALVALNIDQGARRIWRSAAASATE
jgi:hypothetical protein